MTSVPAGFEPDSVTFVSTSEGWVAGTVPCGSVSCLALARTTDGGLTWRSVPAPASGLAVVRTGEGGTTVSVRFADPMDGWIYAVPSPARGIFDLWSTHDGGTTWTRVHLAVMTPQSDIVGMEAGGGRVYVVVYPANFVSVHIESSPVGNDSWTDIDTGVPIGAGPVPSADLVIQDGYGWFVENDRAVVGGVLLVPQGGWSTWTPPPCDKAMGEAIVAASSRLDLVAVCGEGVWGPAGNLPAGSKVPSEWLFNSTNGGDSFQAVAALPSSLTPSIVATPAPATIVVGGVGGVGPSSVLSASFDGGLTWQTVYQGPQSTEMTYVGFTTLTQGVAVESGQSTSVVLITRDSGHTWTPVAFDDR